MSGKMVERVWKDFLKKSGLEPTLLKNLKVVNSVPGRVNLELEIQKEHTNRLQILHGGTIASLVDLGGSLAVSSRGLFSTGVSTDINISYISSGGVIGDKVHIDCKCDKLGQTLAFTRMEFRNSKNQLFARGSHTKYVANALKDPLNELDNCK